MQSFPHDLLWHFVGLVDKADVASLASSCLWMCHACRFVHGRRLQLSGGQGRELFSMPSTRAFSSCRSLEYRLLHDKLVTDVIDLQLAVASAALQMPHVHEVRIILPEDPSAADDEPQRKAVQNCIRALQHLKSLRQLNFSSLSSIYESNLQSLHTLTALTALQLEAAEPFELPTSIAQLSQLRQLQLSGAMLPQLEDGTAHDLRLVLPSKLTGLTFLAQCNGWEQPWARQLQHCGDSICSLEVQLNAACCSEDSPSPFLLELTTAAGGGEGSSESVLPQLTAIVFQKIACYERHFALSLPTHSTVDGLFPSLQCFRMLDSKSFVNCVMCTGGVLGLSRCCQGLRELSWLGYCLIEAVDNDDGDGLPSHLVFSQLTSLKVESLCMFADDGGYDVDSVIPWPGEEAPGSSSVMHQMFPALQVLTVGRCETCDNELISAAAAGLARCTGITRLVLRLESGAASCSVEWFKSVAAGLSSLQQLEVLLDYCTIRTTAVLASWPSQAVAGLAAFTQLQRLRIELPPWERVLTEYSIWWIRRSVCREKSQPEAADNMQVALLRLLCLHQLQRLELCNIAGVSAAVLATLTAQLPALQLLQLEGCSEGPDELEQQWHTAEAAAASSSGAAGGVEGSMLSKLQQVRAGLRPGVQLVVQPSSWPINSEVQW